MSNSLKESLKRLPAAKKKEVQKLLTELEARKKYRDGLLSESFKQQRAFIQDEAPLKAALCTRRAGKTYGIGLYFDLVASQRPGCNMLYTGLTRQTAKRVLKKDCMDAVQLKCGSRRKWRETDTAYRYSNGSILYLLGADANEEERKKALGQKFALVVIDESQDYTIDLAEFVMQTLKPSVADDRGQIVLTGTPGNNIHSFYHKVTTGQVPGWSLHKWSAFDNPHMANQWRSEIADFEAMYGKEVLYTLPWFRQQYLGEWVIDSDALVYRYDRVKNGIQELPDSTEQWWYVLGIDLGWDDATAFTLLAYRDYDRQTYIVESWKRSEMYLSDVEAVLRSYQQKYPTLTAMVIDNADKQAVKELQKRTAIGLLPADKAGKYDFIQILNSELMTGSIQVLEPNCAPLIDEWQTLIWDEKRLEKGDHVEKETAPNHCADAALYAWRYTYSYILKKRKPETNILQKPTIGQVTKQHFDRMKRQRL